MTRRDARPAWQGRGSADTTGDADHDTTRRPVRRDMADHLRAARVMLAAVRGGR